MKPEFDESSGNVFEDMGFASPGQELLKANLTLQIYKLLRGRNLSQSDAAKLLGTTQPQVSALMRCKPTSMSVGRLMEFLTILGQDVEVRVRPAGERRTGGYLSVVTQDEPEVALHRVGG